MKAQKMDKFESKIMLKETGECLLLDTWLRVDHVLSKLLNEIPARRRMKLMKTLQQDVLEVRARLQGESHVVLQHWSSQSK